MTRRGINWDEVPFGATSDDDLARRYGVTRQAVAKQRGKRGVAAYADGPAPIALTKQERDDIVDIETAMRVVLDGRRRDLTVAAAHAVGRVPGWHVEAKTRLGVSGAPDSVIAFAFRAPGRRALSEWMSPAKARAWLLQVGWADEAQRHLGALTDREQRTEKPSATAG